MRWWITGAVLSEGRGVNLVLLLHRNGCHWRIEDFRVVRRVVQRVEAFLPVWECLLHQLQIPDRKSPPPSQTANARTPGSRKIRPHFAASPLSSRILHKRSISGVIYCVTSRTVNYKLCNAHPSSSVASFLTSSSLVVDLQTRPHQNKRLLK